MGLKYLLRQDKESIAPTYTQAYLTALATWQSQVASGAITSTTTTTTVNVPAVAQQTIISNGYTINIPGTPASSYQSTTTTYSTPAPTPQYTTAGGYVGIYATGPRTLVQKVLQCPADPSLGYGGYSNSSGELYLTLNNPSLPWGATNYLANWNALTNGNATQGWNSPPGKVTQIPDGPSTTILFSEGYAWCDGIGRTALLAWQGENCGSGINCFNYGYDYTTNQNVYGMHNFGLTYTLGAVNITLPNGNNLSITSAQGQNGFPNPTTSGLNFFFQVQPLALPSTICAAQGKTNCCNNLTAQSGHSTVLNVCMGDGSVHGVSPTMSTTTWLYAMLPNDGQPLGSDWGH